MKIKGGDPCQYALKLLEKLFPVEDRVGKCYRRGPRTPYKPLLDPDRVKILESNTYFWSLLWCTCMIQYIMYFFTDCIKYRFGLEQFLASESNFGERINQKCRDAKRKSINKKE
ncbi:MAG: hypothetical protein MJE68_10410 [Proteobacteria bacterium]|nr:hypothetical protein [Pseudomonadota bacterium]